MHSFPHCYKDIKLRIKDISLGQFEFHLRIVLNLTPCFTPQQMTLKKHPKCHVHVVVLLYLHLQLDLHYSKQHVH